MKHTLNTCLAGAAILAALATSQVAAPAANAAAADPAGAEAACLVPQSGVMECFPTVALLLAQTAVDALVADTSCPLYLYSGVDYTGRLLVVEAQGYWVNLSDYSFDNTTVSFAGTGCGFHLAQNANGGGSWYPGNTGPWALSPNMGAGWNDAISSVYID